MDIVKSIERENCKSLYQRRLYTAIGKSRRNEVVHERNKKKIKRNDPEKRTGKDIHHSLQRITHPNEARLSMRHIISPKCLGNASGSSNKIKLKRPQTAPMFPEKSRTHTSNLVSISRPRKSYENSIDYVNHTRSNLNLRAKEREESNAKRRAEIYNVNKILKERFDKEFNEFMERKKKEFELSQKEKY